MPLIIISTGAPVAEGAKMSLAEEASTLFSSTLNVRASARQVLVSIGKPCLAACWYSIEFSSKKPLVIIHALNSLLLETACADCLGSRPCSNCGWSVPVLWGRYYSSCSYSEFCIDAPAVEKANSMPHMNINCCVSVTNQH
jgi:hypothetical protein